MSKRKLDVETGELVAVAEAAQPVQWKTPWNHDRDHESERTGLITPEPSLTKQEFVEESDINVILERFLRTGEPPPMALPEHFTDLSERPTYFEIQEKLATASAMFYELPPKLRAEYQNDPTRWADAVSNAAARDDLEALIKLGIDAKEKPQEPTKADPPSPATPATKASTPASEALKQGDDDTPPPKPPSDKGKK